MKRTYRALTGSAIVLSIIIVAAVCWYSLEEIHYLKSFYPSQFSVEEAFYASAVELVKIIIISLTFFLIIGTGLYVLRHITRES
ncbi:MAG: hypothetical protein V3V64_03895 [Acidiferrobacterales bacterium]